MPEALQPASEDSRSAAVARDEGRPAAAARDDGRPAVAPSDDAASSAASAAAARRDLRDQIARLEGELAAALMAGFPRREPVRPGHAPPALGGPRLLSLGELELVRDDLVGRLETLRAGGAAQRLAAMHADPAAHRGAVVTSAELGEPGCRRWVVRPRLGPVGRLAGWWRVVVSSGCPLRAPRRRRPARVSG